jgi:hypothetical protein
VYIAFLLNSCSCMPLLLSSMSPLEYSSEMHHISPLFYPAVKCLLETSTSYVKKCHCCSRIKFITQRKVENFRLRNCMVLDQVWVLTLQYSLRSVQSGIIVVEELCLIEQSKCFFMDSALEYKSQGSSVGTVTKL